MRMTAIHAEKEDIGLYGYLTISKKAAKGPWDDFLKALDYELEGLKQDLISARSELLGGSTE